MSPELLEREIILMSGIGQRELESLTTCYSKIPRSLIVPFVSVTPFADNTPVTDIRSGVDPCVNAKAARRVQIRRVWDTHELVDTIEIEGSPDFSGCEPGAIHRAAVVSSDPIVRISITGPPAHEA